MGTENRKTRMRPAQRDSKMSNFRSMGESMGKTENKTRPAQRDSENSILPESQTLHSLHELHGEKMFSAQRDSKMSNGRLSGLLCWPHGQNSFPQLDSKMSNLVLTPSPLRPLRLNLLSAQQYSKMSNLVSHLRNLRNLRTNLFCAQHDSKMSNFGLGEHCHTEGAENTEKGIFTMLIKNKVRCFMGRLVDESMSKMQNGSAQRDSKMSNLKIETENSLPQRHSGMSLLDFGGIASAEHSKQTMFIELIKNMAGCFGRLSGLLCWPHGGRLSGDRPVQRGSGISIFGNCLLVFKTSPAQQDSGNSILGNGPFDPSDTIFLGEKLIGGWKSADNIIYSFGN